MSMWQEVREILTEEFRRVGRYNVQCRLPDFVFSELGAFLFGSEKSLMRQVLIQVCGGFGFSSGRTNQILEHVNYPQLAEGEAADGTRIVDLEERVTSLEVAARALRKKRRSSSREEVEAMCLTL